MSIDSKQQDPGTPVLQLSRIAVAPTITDELEGILRYATQLVHNVLPNHKKVELGTIQLAQAMATYTAAQLEAFFVLTKEDASRTEAMQRLLRQQFHLTDETPAQLLYGSTAKAIARACTERQVDLLVLGDNTEEHVFELLFGNVLRTLLGIIHCPVLIFTDPISGQLPKLSRIVAELRSEAQLAELLRWLQYFRRYFETSEIVLVKEVYVPGSKTEYEFLNLEEENDALPRWQRDELQHIEHQIVGCGYASADYQLRVINSKPGIGITRLAKDLEADLLVLHTEQQKFGLLSRLFPSHAEYALSEVPCNMLFLK